MRNGTVGLWIGVAAFIGARLGLEIGPDGFGESSIDAALVAALILAGVGFLLRAFRHFALLMVLGGIVAGSFAWAGHHAIREEPSLLRVAAGHQPELVRVRVRLLERLLPAESIDTDLLDRFIHPRTDPSWRADSALVSIWDGAGWRNASGTLRLAFTETVDELPIGCTIVVVGWLRAESAGDGPMSMVSREPSPCRRRVGVLRTDVQPVMELDPPPIEAILGSARKWLDDNLLNCLGSSTPERIRCLVIAMTTGRTLPGIRPMREMFKQAGLGHFLAISGFNVAVLFAIARCGMEWCKVDWRLRGWALLGLGVVFLALVEPGVSVLRAGIAGSLAGLAMGLRRGWSPDGVLGCAATVSLMLDPCAAADLGFQLSYGAVYGLLHGTAPIERLLGATESMRGAHKWMHAVLRTPIAASLAAWLVSLPITMASSGSMHPWCAVVSTVLGPLAAVITVLSSIGAVTGWIPGIELVQRPLLGGLARCMELGVGWSTSLPAQRWVSGPIPWEWSVVGLACLLLWWGRAATRDIRRIVVITMVLCWLLGAALLAQHQDITPPTDDAVFSWTTIPMGEGCAHVIQDGGVTTVIDPGSRTLRACGSGRLLPALKAMGVRSIDRIVIRQPSIDRFSAVPEIVDAMPVAEIVMGPGWDRSWPSGSAADALLDSLRKHDVRIRPPDHDVSWFGGPLTWRCTTPAGHATSHDSIIVTIRHEDWPEMPLAMLLRGCDGEALDRYVSRDRIQHPLVVEWPPARSETLERSALLRELAPKCVLEVTGTAHSDKEALQAAHSGVLWARPLEVAPMRLIVRRAPREVRLFQWRGGCWQPVIP